MILKKNLIFNLFCKYICNIDLTHEMGFKSLDLTKNLSKK
jgi:hypothetical protein